MKKYSAIFGAAICAVTLAFNAFGTMWTGGGSKTASGDYVWNDNANWGGNTPPRYSSGVAQFPENCTVRVNLSADYFGAGQTQLKELTIPASSHVTLTGSELGTAAYVNVTTTRSFSNLTLDNGAHLYCLVPAGAVITVLNGSKLTLPNQSSYSGVTIDIQSGSTLAANTICNFKDGCSISLSGASTMTGVLPTGYTHDGTLTVDGGSTATFTDFKPTSGLAVRVKGASTLVTTGCFYANTAGCDVEVSGGSTFSARSHVKLGKGVNLVIDDSTFEVTTQTMQMLDGSTADHTDVITFKGTAPQLKVSSNISLNANANGLRMDFEVPTGGYAVSPVRQLHASNKLFSSQTASRPVRFGILPTSPAIDSGYTTKAQLVSSAPGITGYASMDFAPSGSAAAADAFAVTSGGGTVPATSDATAQEVWVTLGSGPIAELPVAESKGVAAGVSTSVSLTNVTVSANVSQLANLPGYTTRARVFAGPSADALQEVATVPVTAKGQFDYVYAAPAFDTEYAFQCVLETLNGSAAVTYTESSPVVTARTAYEMYQTALYVYVWHPDAEPNADGSYNWADKNNWWYYNNGAFKGHSGYPINSGDQLAWFPPEANVTVFLDLSPSGLGGRKLSKIEVHRTANVTLTGVCGNFQISTLLDGNLTLGSGMEMSIAALTAGHTVCVQSNAVVTPPPALADVTIAVTNGTYVVPQSHTLTRASVTLDGPFAATSGGKGISSIVDATLTLDHGASAALGSLALGSGGRLELKNGSTNTVSGTFYATTGGTIALSGGSCLQQTYGACKTGLGLTFEIDDSTVSLLNLTTAQGTGDTGGETFVFRGASPVLSLQNSLSGNKTANGVRFDFDIPDGGYTVPPVQLASSSAKIFDNAGVGTVAFNVLAGSAQLEGRNKNVQLIATGSAGVYSSGKGSYSLYDVFNFDSAASVTNHTAFLRTTYGGTTETGVPAETREVYVNLGSQPPITVFTESKGVAGGATLTRNGRVYTLSSTVAQLANASGYTTRIKLLAGTDPDALAVVATEAVTETGPVALSWTAPNWNETYYVRYLLETLDGDGQVVYGENSPSASQAAVDEAAYTWKADANGNWDGLWSDPAHWSDDKGGDAVGYPNNGKNQVYFPKDCTATIGLDRTVSVKGIRLGAGLGEGGQVLVFTNTSATVSDNALTLVSVSGGYAGSGFYTAAGRADVTFRGVTVTLNTWHDEGPNNRVVLDEGAVYRASGYHMGLTNDWLYVLGGSTFDAGGEFLVGTGGPDGSSGGVVISNSNVSCTWLKISREADKSPGYAHVVFCGVTPTLRITSGACGNYLNGVLSFDFDIPANGYAANPIVGPSTGSPAPLFSGTPAKYGNPTFRFSVLKSSPALRTAGKWSQTLIDWPTGYEEERISPTDTRKVSFAINDTVLDVTLRVPGLCVIVK